MPKTLTLILPTANTDGSAVVAGEVTDVQIGFGTATGNYTLVADDTAFAAQTDANGVVTIPFTSLNETLASGNWFAASRVKTAAGQVSGWSKEATFAIVPPTPNPPTGFSIA